MTRTSSSELGEEVKFFSYDMYPEAVVTYQKSVEDLKTCRSCRELDSLIRKQGGLPVGLRIISENVTFAKYLYAEQMAVVKLRNESASAALSLYVNDTYLHALPLILNTISNWYANLTMPGKSAHIFVGSKPYQLEALVHYPSSVLIGIICMGLAFNTIPTGLSFDIVQDRIVSSHFVLHLGLPVLFSFQEIAPFRLEPKTF